MQTNFSYFTSAAMSRNKLASGLGRSLIKKREHERYTSSRHTTDFAATNTAISITENTSVDEFLSHAESAQRSFEAERGRYGIVEHEGERLDDLDEEDGLGSDGEDEEDDEANFCSIPKKPDWRESEGAEAYIRAETEQFLKWKKMLNRIQNRRRNLPPFEKNLEFWKQLWKIVEISDVVIQVADARDPLFYYSRDLADYVKEVSPDKESVVLLNKADFLTREQREAWADNLRESDVKALFFSAVGDDEKEGDNSDFDEAAFNTARILTPTQVLQTVQTVASVSPLTVGFLGYPNVGKSSTINCFLSNKRLQVSATPGKTKHYQTHVLKGEVKLVDGPGLVMPNLNMTKADMVLAGILPIDNLTDFMPSMDLLLSKIPAHHVEKHYGLMRSCVDEARKTNRKSPSMQTLSAMALMRGFFKPGGVPDQFRAARIVLKDYVQGKLLYCKAPPNVDQETFCPFEKEEESSKFVDDISLVESFPELRMPSGVHVRGVKSAGIPNVAEFMNKKHAHKKKKDKARRMFKDPYA